MQVMSHRFYIELDSLLDTRLGCLATLYPDIATELLGPAWINRESDLMSDLHPDINDEVFEQAYKRRDEKILAASRLTAIYASLAEIMTDATEQPDALPNTQRLTLDINIYPYYLSDDARDLMAACVAHNLRVPTEINVVRYPLAQISPKFLAERYEYAFIYNIYEWTKQHREAIMDRPYPRVVMVYPRLFFADSPTRNPEIMKDIPSATDIFLLFEFEFQTRLTLRGLPAWEFSIVMPTA